MQSARMNDAKHFLSTRNLNLDQSSEEKMRIPKRRSYLLSKMVVSQQFEQEK